MLVSPHFLAPLPCWVLRRGVRQGGHPSSNTTLILSSAAGSWPVLGRWTPMNPAPPFRACFWNLIHQKSQFSSYLTENKQVHFVPWLLNFNGFREKLICRIMALLSCGFLLSEPQTLGSPAGSVNEEQDVSHVQSPAPRPFELSITNNPLADPAARA